jgi:hypothetical protein
VWNGSKCNTHTEIITYDLDVYSAQQFKCNKEDHTQQRETEGVNRIGWTFYNNVVVSYLNLKEDSVSDLGSCICKIPITCSDIIGV